MSTPPGADSPDDLTDTVIPSEVPDGIPTPKDQDEPSTDWVPDAEQVPDRPDWVPPRISDFEEGPHGDQ